MVWAAAPGGKCGAKGPEKRGDSMRWWGGERKALRLMESGSRSAAAYMRVECWKGWSLHSQQRQRAQRRVRVYSAKSYGGGRGGSPCRRAAGGAMRARVSKTAALRNKGNAAFSVAACKPPHSTQVFRDQVHLRKNGASHKQVCGWLGPPVRIANKLSAAAAAVG